ncbi:hypothetical protein N7517_008349 [Penicillium concentricum]|uniref:Peptidase M20 domain-containing protein 2 n=1 Tax=Penicillium concentricum TaxID=293559 RepID=A0A9W9RS83_9EURO|nr:uncharacterized protein N7517_008349 [Penicillium concentricum]KAJ5365463.1 hypothetical protein N7517_008349 [Penicillium concentricum]
MKIYASGEQLQTNAAKNAQLIFDSINNHSKSLRHLNLEIHGNPETSYAEFQAHENIATFLENNGAAVTRHAFGLQTSFLAEYGKGGRVVTFCAEYDALPDIGHGCGHNLIAVSSIAAFLGIVAVLQKFPLAGRVRLVGCPAEEGGGGKIDLIRAGAFAEVDAALMMHPTPPVNQFLTEVAGISYGTCLSTCAFEATFSGKAAHAAAMPWDGINALDAATLSYAAVGMLRQHIKPSDRINIIMPEGGIAQNIIPDKSRVGYNVRSEKVSDMEALRVRVENCFKGAATATGCTLDLKRVMETYKEIRPNEALCTEFSRYMKGLGQDFVCDLQRRYLSAFSTDMGNVSYEVPSFHGNFSIPVESGAALHTESFKDAAETTAAHDLAMGVAKGMAAAGLKVIIDDLFAKQVKDDFEQDKMLR